MVRAGLGLDEKIRVGEVEEKEGSLLGAPEELPERCSGFEPLAGVLDH